MEKRIMCISYNGAHKIHKEWFNSVGNHLNFQMPEGNKIQNLHQYLANSSEIPGETDLIICEDHFSIRTGLAYKVLNPRTKVIRLVADEGYYKCISGKKYPFEEILFHRFLDGAIAVSPLAKLWAQKFVNGPINVVRPYIPDLNNLLNLEKEPQNRKEVLFIGYNNPNKNIGSLVEAVRKVKDLRLNIVGKGHKEYEEEFIKTYGYVEDIKNHLSRSDIYVQPSEGDTYPVASLEAMAASIPTIVTESCGTKEIVESVDSKLVSGEDSKSIAASLKYVLGLEGKNRETLALEFRQKAEKLDRKSSIDSFNEAMKEWVR